MKSPLESSLKTIYGSAALTYFQEERLYKQRLYTHDGASKKKGEIFRRTKQRHSHLQETNLTRQLKPPPRPLRERRKEGRISEENKVKFRVASKGKTPQVRKTYYALTKDISVGGIRMLTEKYLPVGTELRMEIALLDSNKVINLVGKVRWINCLYDNELYEMGVEFRETLSDKTVALIEHVYEK
jgi:c-di-GMP-binding flagellar brake protein YcgR